MVEGLGIAVNGLRGTTVRDDLSKVADVVDKSVRRSIFEFMDTKSATE